MSVRVCGRLGVFRFSVFLGISPFSLCIVYPYIAAYKARILIFENIWNANDADRIILFSRVGLENGLDRENPYCERIWGSSCSIIIGIAVTKGQSRLN